MALDRVELGNLAELRLKDAKLLLDHGQHDGGYYLVGYAVECALKAIIATRTRQHEFPDLNLAKKVYTHNLKELLDASGVKVDVEQEFAKDPDLRDNWNIVKDWAETSRYEAGRQKGEADALYAAITDPAHGVLTCISKYW
jgi:HEPN domain-containing protein